MTGSKATGIVLALICIALACLPAAAHGALTPWRLDPRGGWEPLEPVNPYATIQGGILFRDGEMRVHPLCR